MVLTILACLLHKRFAIFESYIYFRRAVLDDS